MASTSRETSTRLRPAMVAVSPAAGTASRSARISATDQSFVSARAAFVVDKNGVIQYSEQTPTPKDLPNFAAVKEANGDIYGRGTQDMKSVGIQHIEAIYRLKVEQKVRLKRTIHLW